MAYTFDGPTSIVSFDSSTTAFDVRDLWTSWVNWFVTSDNSKYLPAMRCVGGDPLPGSKELGLSYFMLNGWKIKPYEESHVLSVNGNIYSEDGSSPFTPVLGAYNVTIINTVSNLVDSTVQQLPEIEYASFDGCVSYDSVGGYPGIEYQGKPVGTKLYPSNNLATVLVIAQIRGLSSIKLLSDLTITAGQNVSAYRIISDTWKVVTVEPGAITTDTEFEKISLYGEMCGTWNLLVDCWAYNITNFLGWMRGGSLEHVELAPYTDPDPFSLGSSYFDDVVPMYANVHSVLVMNDNVSVSFTNCMDMVDIHSMTTGSVINAELNGGRLTIDPSCVGGEIIVSGVGECFNNSLLTVNDCCLMNEDTAWGAIATANNIAGTMGNKLNTASSGGVDFEALSDAVWSKDPGTVISGSIGDLLKKIYITVRNIFSLSA